MLKMRDFYTQAMEKLEERQKEELQRKDKVYENEIFRFENLLCKKTEEIKELTNTLMEASETVDQEKYEKRLKEK